MEAKPTIRRKTVRDMWRGRFVMVILSAFVAFTVMTGIASAEEFKQFGVRLRALAVIPDQEIDSQLAGDNIKAKFAEAPELDLEYFFTKNISSELILGIVKSDLTSSVDAEHNIGSTWLLPPTLTVKYHPLAGSLVSPYVGVGATWIIPFKESVNVAPDAKIYANVSWAAQAGADIALGNNLYLNADFKYLNDDTHIRLNGVRYKLDLNPYVIGLGVGYRF